MHVLTSISLEGNTSCITKLTPSEEVGICKNAMHTSSEGCVLRHTVMSTDLSRTTAPCPSCYKNSNHCEGGGANFFL